MWFFNDGASAGRLSKKANSAVIDLENTIKTLEKGGGDAELIQQLQEHSTSLKQGQADLKSSLTKGGEHFTNAKEALKDTMSEARTSVKTGKTFLNDIKSFNKASKPMGALKKTGLVALGVAGAAAFVSWASGKRKEAREDSREALLDQQAQAMNAINNLSSNNSPLLGANTLGGLERVEGANVAKYARPSNQGIDLSQPTLSV